MHPPIAKFSNLSLSRPAMGPVTRSQRHTGDPASEAGDPGSSTPTSGRRHPLLPLEGRAEARHGDDNVDDEDVDDEDDDDEDDDDYDEDDGPVRSPLTNLFYNIDNLDDETQELVRELFRPPPPEETPPIVIEWCGISNDPDVYAFQLQEVVPRTIRIGSPTSRIPTPSCNCTGSEARPCRHLVWLMDQIAKQTLPSHPPGEPLTLGVGSSSGSASAPREGLFPELGNAYARIADFHIDVLANTLHCGAGPPTGHPSLHRVREAREILAGLDGIQDAAGVETYAPDIFDLAQPELERLLWGAERRRRGSSPEEAGSQDEGDDDGEEEEDSGEEEDTESSSEAETGSNSGNGSRSSKRTRRRQKGKRPADTPSGREHAARWMRHQLHQQQQEQQQEQQQQQISEHFAHPRRLVERGDLRRTVLRLLVSNDTFFAMFLKLLAPRDMAHNPFRKIQQRVETVLGQLLTLGASSASPSSSTDVSVSWAARHVENAVQQIGLLLLQEHQHQHQNQHQHRWARRSAGRALVWIFYAVVFQHNRDAHAGATQDDRNLYQRLIGNSGGSSVPGSASPTFFLLDQLQLLADQVEFRSRLEQIRHRIQLNGYRAPYMRRLDTILAQMRPLAPVPHGRDTERVSTLLPPPPPPLFHQSGSGSGGGNAGEGSGVGSRAPTEIPPAAGAKRQVSGGGALSDRRPKRRR